MTFTPPPAAVQINIKSTADVANTGVKMLVYGSAGVGKTRLAVTSPAPIILSAEGGILSLKQYALPFLEVHTIAELEAYYQWLAYDQTSWQFQTVMLDSVSEVAEVVLANEMKNNKDPRKAYGEMATHMMGILRQFRDLPGRHVIFTAKMGKTKDEQTGGIVWGPMMPGQQLDQQLPYMFDEVFHLGSYRSSEGQTYEALRTRADNQYQAKDRSGMLDAWEPPDIGHIIAKIMG